MPSSGILLGFVSGIFEYYILAFTNNTIQENCILDYNFIYYAYSV